MFFVTLPIATTNKTLIDQLWYYRRTSPVFVTFRAHAVLQSQGGKGAQCPGRQITGGGEKSQQCLKYFLQYSKFVSERP